MKGNKRQKKSELGESEVKAAVDAPIIAVPVEKSASKNSKSRRGRRSKEKELNINKEARKIRESLQNKETMDLQDTTRFCYQCKTKMSHSHHIFCPMSPEYDEENLKVLLKGTSKGCRNCRLDILLPKGKSRDHDEHIPCSQLYEEPEDGEKGVLEVNPSTKGRIGSSTEKEAMEKAIQQDGRTQSLQQQRETIDHFEEGESSKPVKQSEETIKTFL